MPRPWTASCSPPLDFGGVRALLGGLRRVALAVMLAWAGVATAQVPLPMQEQVQLFNSLPPAQQQALIRELQRQLPPAQREAIVRMLQAGPDQEITEEPDFEVASTLEEVLQSQLFAADDEGDDEEDPRLEPRDTLVIDFTLRDPLPANVDAEQVTEFRERLAEGNPYQLDGLGMLLLPGVPAIALAGLNVDEVTIRVQAEPALRAFEAIVTFLPLEPVGTAALEPFGYELFERNARAFLPSSDLPVPVDYVIGPGDSVTVQLFGNQNEEVFLEVSREGTINFPGIGPLTVSGLTLADLRATVSERVQEQLIGTRASVTLSELRSIRVFVLGEVERPGLYTVAAQSTITGALFSGGGVTPIGSLRNVALRRAGETVVTLDLYDLLLRGDTRADLRVEQEDVIFVPPVGPTVSVDGEVRRPAIYEIKNERSVAEVVALAGGLNANADRRAAKLERVVPSRGTTVRDVDLTGGGAQTAVADGDVLRVPENLEQLEASVRLAGNVFQPGPYQWFDGMRLTDLIPSPELVRPLSDINYVLIRRELAANVDIELLSADLQAAWRQPTGAANVALRPRDTVNIFNIEQGRMHVLEPIIDEIEAQAPPNTPLPLVRVGGQVRSAGEYPLEPNMRVSDLLRAGGGMSEAAYATEAELTRYSVINGEYRETELLRVDLAGLLRGNPAADVVLEPYDYLNVKEVSRWRGAEAVTIRGEVAFPGNYPIRRGETLSSVLARAGGLTDLAFAEGSIFTRVESREREREQLDALASRVERDLAAVSVQDPNASQTISTGQTLISNLRNTVATGRVVIRLDELVAGNTSADVVLQDGDQLIVPEQRQEVTVIGEVQYATSHIYAAGLDSDDYIARSGGLTQRADRKRIYVVRASGEVVPAGGRWFQRDSGGNVRPGDAVVVPLELDQSLARWQAITQIIYNLAIAAAAVNSF
jgi:protein involved in polysaccharide export with SLBB domain